MSWASIAAKAHAGQPTTVKPPAGVDQRLEAKPLFPHRQREQQQQQQQQQQQDGSEEARVTGNHSDSSVPTPAPAEGHAGAGDSSLDQALARELECLVIDTGGLILGTNLLRLAPDDGFFTTRDVVEEVRDKKTRAFVEAFPFEIRLREPTAESMKAVADFARKTGDFDALSATDLRVIGLAHTLERELEGDKFLRSAPEKIEVDTESAKVRRALAKGSETNTLFFASSTGENTAQKNPDGRQGRQGKQQNQQQEEQGASLPGWADVDEESEDGWITQDNVADVTAALSGQFRLTEEEIRERKVGIITTDYSMQNVILQMGLHLVSVQGMHIRRVKQWVLRCFGCMTITRDTSKKFCPSCGHTTVQRVAMHVGGDGKVVYEHNPRKVVSTRGTRFSIPKAKGGRMNNDLILSEDVYKDKTKFMRKDDGFGFAPDAVRGAKAGRLGADVDVGFGRRNPNVGRKKVGKKNRTQNRF